MKNMLELVKYKQNHLPLIGTLHKPSNIYKLYGCWDHSLRFAKIRKYLETRIWNSNSPYIWLYCAKGKISSLSFSILNLQNNYNMSIKSIHRKDWLRIYDILWSQTRRFELSSNLINARRRNKQEDTWYDLKASGHISNYKNKFVRSI